MSFTLIIGVIRGFSCEVISLLCWVMGCWTSLHFSMEISPILESFIFLPSKRLAVTFIGLLVITILAGSLLQHWLTTRFKQTYNHTVVMERLGGLFCGLMQGIVLTTMVVLLAGLSALPTSTWWHDSSLLPSFQILAIWLRDHVAPHMANYITYR